MKCPPHGGKMLKFLKIKFNGRFGLTPNMTVPRPQVQKI
jgi:hypothetical protein